MSRLGGQIVMIAGGTSGMGRATAIAAAREGATVVVVGRRAESLEHVRQEILQLGGRARVFQADATDEEAIGLAIGAVIEQFGHINALVNCVGTNIRERSLDEVSRDRWDALLTDNLTASFTLTRAVVPVLRHQGGGLLIHVTSAAVNRPDLSGVGYQAAKAGVMGLAHATMQEERERGIRVSVVYPGLTETRLVDRRPTPVPPETLAKAMQPEDIADVCVALLALPARTYVPDVSVYPSLLL